jgi:hypothetical protein
MNAEMEYVNMDYSREIEEVGCGGDEERDKEAAGNDAHGAGETGRTSGTRQEKRM